MSDDPKLPEIFWMTRERIGVDLSNEVDVWAVRPQRRRYENGDVMWWPPDHLDIDREHSIVDTWTIAEAKRRYAGAPDTDLECVVVGGAR